MRPLRVLTWHVHGNYLLYLSQAHVEFYLPYAPGRPGYGGRGETFPFPDRVHEIPAEAVCDLDFDCILFQSKRNFVVDQFEILSEAQRALPRVYLEHDPPQEHPTDTRHPVDDPEMLLVHVTPFNALMWNSGRTPTRVIEHGVFIPPGTHYTGELAKGIAVVNHLKRRGRRLGADVFERARNAVPLDLVGMDAEALGGVGEISPPELAQFESRYRFFFNPIRYTSLGLAVIEAMMVGLPVVGLATTEMATVIENGVSGYVSTDLDRLIDAMHELLADPVKARRLGERAQRAARERFSIERFASEWEDAFTTVAGRAAKGRTLVAPALGVAS
jgi:glycosyltransferase involved in cell wall biosynthesis